ncbi:sodium-dependent phosphate transporter [Clostridium baratii]|nr:sodium-dependent phosphate transporter [Clostridium baratii]
MKIIYRLEEEVVNILAIVSGLIGGLGLFLFGMKLMGDGLENAAGEKLKSIIEKVTSNRIIGVLVGAFVTAIIQSSSATTVMVVSFVNAGLMNLVQAASIIMGANIGTTITAQMVSFNLEGIAPLVIGIGVIITLVAKNKKVRDIASILLGFGLLFLGMGMMSGAMKPVADSDIFKHFVVLVGDNIFLGILAGLLMTALVQSSSATTGILIALAASGAIKLNVALPIILGCNIGTCITALISAVGVSKTAKKAAIIHLLFNVIGTIIFIPFVGILVNIVQSISPGSVARQVANAHTIFNITVTLILLPFINFLVLIANKILPGDDKVEKKDTIYLDDKLLENPVIASVQAEKETLRMAEKARENFILSMEAFRDSSLEHAEKVMKNEEVIDTLEKDIADYLMKISQSELSGDVNNSVTANFHVISDLERIGDHAKNIAELAIEKVNGKVHYDEEEKQDLKVMYNTTLEVVEMAFNTYENKDLNNIDSLAKLEDAIDNMEKELRNSHIKRLSSKKGSAHGSVIFLDIISNLERIGDHAVNIAEVISER